MEVLRKNFAESPEIARIAPLGIFCVLTALQGQLGPGSEFWLYLAKILVGAWLIREMRPYVQEMRWSFSWEAVVVGVAVVVLWVGLDGHYPRLSKLAPEAGWNPGKHYGPGSLAAWFFYVVHIAGFTVVVPPIEEVFYRSFLYRYFIKVDFRSLPLGQFHLLSFLATSTIFGLMHPDRWVAGILCGLAYQWLVIRKGRLGDAVVAHGLTNFLLGVYIVWKGAWSFW